MTGPRESLSLFFSLLHFLERVCSAHSLRTVSLVNHGPRKICSATRCIPRSTWIGKSFRQRSSLPTNLFLNPTKVGDEVSVELGRGRLSSIQEAQPDGTRTVVFEVNGEPGLARLREVAMLVCP
jgi:hypothetical protein